MKILIENYENHDLKDMIQRAAVAEQDAINTYVSFYKSTDSEEFKKVLDDVIKEETRHISQFQDLIERLFPEDMILMDQGKEENSEILD